MSGPIVIDVENWAEDTDPQQKAGGVRAIRAAILGHDLLKFPNTANVRSASPRKTDVHRDILATVEHEPESFSTRHGGVVIWAKEVERRRGKLVITDASIVDGGQTQSVIDTHVKNRKAKGLEPNLIYVKVDFIVTRDVKKAQDIAIARNNNNPVKAVSKLGKRGYFDEIDEVLKSYFARTVTPYSLAKEENAKGDFLIPALDYVRVAQMMLPAALYPDGAFGSYKQNLYRSKVQTRKRFVHLYDTKDSDPVALAQYNFIRDFGPTAWKLAELWRDPVRWKGLYLREKTGCLEFDKTLNANVISEGILLPTLAALTAFMSGDDAGRWSLARLTKSDEDRLTAAVAKVLRGDDIGREPGKLGKAAWAYDSLLRTAQEIREQREARRVPR